MEDEEGSRSRADRRREELNLPSSSFLARPLAKSLLAKHTKENSKRRTTSAGNLSLHENDDDLNDNLDHDTDLPTPVAVDFSELAFLLKGTES